MQKLEMLIKTVDSHYDSLHEIHCYYLTCSLLNIARGTCNLMIVNETEDGPTIYCKGCFNAIQIRYMRANQDIIKNNMQIPLFPVKPLID